MRAFYFCIRLFLSQSEAETPAQKGIPCFQAKQVNIPDPSYNTLAHTPLFDGPAVPGDVIISTWITLPEYEFYTTQMRNPILSMSWLAWRLIGWCSRLSSSRLTRISHTASNAFRSTGGCHNCFHPQSAKRYL
jgi:hypothetical protein